jgi:hypothetical protein
MAWVRRRELYRPNDRRLSAKLVPTLTDRGCRVVSGTNRRRYRTTICKIIQITFCEDLVSIHNFIALLRFIFHIYLRHVFTLHTMKGEDGWWQSRIWKETIAICFNVPWKKGRLCGLVVRVPGYRSGGPGSMPGATRFFLRSSGSGTGSTQPHEDNWGAISRK